jgi:phosphoesterase RecJ-like protein
MAEMAIPSEAPVLPLPLSWSPPGLDGAIERAWAHLDDARRVAVVSHARPDGDAIGSLVAAYWMLVRPGVEVVPLNADGVPRAFQFLAGADQVVDHAPDDWVPDVLVVLDCGEPRRLGGVIPAAWLAGPVVVVDHHEPWSFGAHAVAVRDVDAASTGELLYRMLAARGLPLSEPIARALLVSLYSDTGSFRYGCTNWRTMELASALFRSGVDAWAVSSELYEQQPLARVRLQSRLLRRVQVSDCGRVAGFVVRQADLNACGASPEHLEGMVNHARGIAGVEVAWELREAGERTWELTLRSRGRVNLSPVSARLGGRSGAFAASMVLTGSERATRARIVAACLAEFGQGDAPSDPP